VLQPSAYLDPTGECEDSRVSDWLLEKFEKASFFGAKK